MTNDTAGLEWEFDQAFQERNWLFTRIGWFVMALIVLAALAGLTGSRGPFANAEIERAGVKITYPRIARWQTADTMTVEFAPTADETAEVLLPPSFTEVFTVETVLPQPVGVTATPKGHLFEFALAGSGSGGSRQASFSLRPEKPAWPMNVAMKVDGRPINFTVTVLP